MRNVFLSISLVLFCVVFSACSTAAKKGPEHFYFGAYSEAESLFNDQQYEEAITSYQMYIDENPAGNLAVISQYYIGKSHLLLGHTDQATEIFKTIVKNNPDLVWANFSKTQLEQLGQ